MNDTENFQKKIEALKQAIRLNPNDAKAHNNLGLAYAGLDRYPEAVDAYKQAIRIKPDDADVHYDLGLAYLSCGNKGSALNQHKILKDLNSDLTNELFNLIYEK